MNKEDKNKTGTISRRNFCKKASLGAGGGILLSTFPLVGFGDSGNSSTNSLSSIKISGRYPHLTMFNPIEARECSVGAVVPWAGRLWVVTYFIRQLYDGEGLYEITPDLKIIKRAEEAVGGCPAARMIHRESNQLFIGPYAIDQNRRVRTISPDKMPGRLTANARHLTQPESKIYYMTMEEGLYEVDVNTLEVRTIFKDAMTFRNTDYSGSGYGEKLPGEHGKGGYSGQGRLVYANNGRSGHDRYRADSFLTSPTGCLAAWDGNSDNWQVIETDQFMEVTGPGGIYGNDSESAPLWSTGWDHRSVILKLLEDGEWHTYRLPKGDASYEGVAGSHTEWFRIRQIGPDGQYLLDHHGMWFDFPGDFSIANHRAPLPIANHLKITPDFTRWEDQLVFGCYEVFKGEGLPERWGPWKGLVGRAQTNLWFTKWEELKNCGQPYGWGGVWLQDRVEAGKPSDPYGFNGFTNRQLHLSHKNNHSISFELEVDRTGQGNWEKLTNITVPAFGYIWHSFDDNLEAEWIRLVPGENGQFVTAYFHYGSGGGNDFKLEMFRALSPDDTNVARSGGLIRAGEGKELQFAAWRTNNTGNAIDAGYYELGEEMQLQRVNNPQAHKQLKEGLVHYNSRITVDEASVIVRDVRGPQAENGKPYRLPKSELPFYQKTLFGRPRILRGESYHKALLNVCGILYTLPHQHSGDVANIKPITTHNKLITDYAYWRGLLVLAGCRNDLEDGGEHFLQSEDGMVGLWVGDLDDLWKLGKPTGVGGPWKNKQVDAGFSSDPYLMAGFDKKSLRLSHDASGPVTFVIEVDFTMWFDQTDGYGRWHEFEMITVNPGETKDFEFPDGFSANWVRLTTDQSCRATAIFTYT